MADQFRPAGDRHLQSCFPILKGTCATTHAFGVAVSGSYAYVADGRGLRVIDISDPVSDPQGDLPPTNARESQSGLLRLRGEHSGLRVIDISNPPTDPQGYMRHHCCLGCRCQRLLRLRGGQTAGLRVVDISNPCPPDPGWYCATTEVLWSSGKRLLRVRGGPLWRPSGDPHLP